MLRPYQKSVIEGMCASRGFSCFRAASWLYHGGTIVEAVDMEEEEGDRMIEWFSCIHNPETSRRAHRTLGGTQFEIRKEEA